MALETLVTALACLSTTTTPLEKPIPLIMKNSLEPLRVDNSTGGCPTAVLGGITARIQHMTEEVKSLKTDLTDLQQLINEYKSQAPASPQLETRIFGPQPFAPIIAPSIPVFNDVPRNCLDQRHGQVRIRIAPDKEPFFVNCNQKLRGGGWLEIAYRFDGSEKFNREWNDYKTGFGSLNSEFFIGLDKLYHLTHSADYELLIVMRSKTGEERFAHYDRFSIGSEAEKYLLYVLGTYKGDAGDGLRYHSGKKFTTIDQDNDDNAQNCARTHTGAWWFGPACLESNLFGTFQARYGNEINYFKGILWKDFVPGPTGSLRYVRMLIRPYRQT